MYKVSGYFDKKEPALCIPLSQQKHAPVFEHIVKHVRDNMFLAFRRPAAKFKKVVIASIGDHLNSDDEQDIASADLYLDVAVITEPSKEIQEKLQKSLHWVVRVVLLNDGEGVLDVIKELNFVINKVDDLIVARTVL